MAECIYMGGVACLTHHSARHDEEQVDCDRALLEDAEATIERVRELHWPNSYSFVDRGYSCGHCGHPYPCDTIRALDGDSDA